MPRLRQTVGTGRAVASQGDVFAAALTAWQKAGNTPGLIYCHGASDSATSPTDSAKTGQYPLFDALRQQYAVAAGDFSGNAWGNDTAISNVGSVKTWLQSTMGAKSGKVGLVGISMGAATALNYARANLANVSCVALIIPALNLADIAANNRGGLASQVNSAYGGTYSDASVGATHNPVDYAASITVPVKIWYSTADTVVVPAAVTTFLAACASATGVVTSTTLDHSEASVAAAPISDVLAFIAANT